MTTKDRTTARLCEVKYYIRQYISATGADVWEKKKKAAGLCDVMHNTINTGPGWSPATEENHRGD